ncbi:MAG TPA: hypothetical protein DEA28_00425 [Firmicutes bacterium]|nr:hypothetical protein [Bacillota bacterium]
MCMYCESFNKHQYYSDELEDVQSTDEGIGISFYRDGEKHWFICAEFEGCSEFDVPSRVAYTDEIKYCPFCGKKLD